MLVTPTSWGVSVLWMRLRSKRRLDYSVFHKHGEKVDKMDEGGDGPGVANEDNIVTELKTLTDLEFSLNLYEDVEEYETKSEVEEAIEIISDLVKAYRHVHVGIKIELGDVEYLQKYPNYDANIMKTSDFLKKARKQLKSVRDDSFQVEKDQKGILDVEKEVLDLKIAQLSNSMDVSKETDVSEIEGYIRVMEKFTSDYYDLCGKSKCLLGVAHGKEPYENAIEKLTAYTKLAKEARRALLENKAKTLLDSSKSLKLDQVLRGKNLSVEINERLASLETKFAQDLDGLGEYQLLEITQNKNLESDFNTVLEKVTDLAGLVSGGGEEVQGLLDSVTSKKDGVIKMKKKFFEQLQKIVLERDVTPDKMRDAASFEIEIPKFSGYDGEIDLYIFKREFEKLIEPQVKKQF